MATREFSRQNHAPRQCRRTTENTWTDVPSSSGPISRFCFYHFRHFIDMLLRTQILIDQRTSGGIQSAGDGEC